MEIRKIGALAAFLNVIVAVATLFVAFALIGPAAIADNSKLVELAINNPTSLMKRKK